MLREASDSTFGELPITLLDMLKDRPSIYSNAPICRTLSVNLHLVRRLSMLDVPSNTWMTAWELATSRTWSEAVPLLGGDLGVQPSSTWLRKQQRRVPHALRKLFWVQNTGRRKERRVKSRPDRVCEAAKARQNQ